MTERTAVDTPMPSASVAIDPSDETRWRKSWRMP
jgi:hypothetical protein